MVVRIFIHVLQKYLFVTDHKKNQGRRFRNSHITSLIRRKNKIINLGSLHKMLERNLQDIFFAESFFRKQIINLMHIGFCAAFGNFRSKVSTL
jgi:hypothetical protein